MSVEDLCEKVSVSFEFETFSFVDSIKAFLCTSEQKQIVSDVSIGLKPKEELLHVPAVFYPIYIHFYLDGGFQNQRRHVHIIKSQENLINNTYIVNKKVELIGCVKRFPLDCDSKLCVDVQVTMLSETGVPCRVNFGRVVIDLCKLGTNLMNYKMKMHSISGNPTKSYIGVKNFTISAARLSANGPTEPVFIHTGNIFSEKIDEDFNADENCDYIDDYTKKYTNLVEQFDKSLSIFMKDSDEIRCPTNPSQVTFENTDIPMPLVSFLYTNPLVTTEKFWINQLIIYASRHLSSRVDWYTKNNTEITNDEFLIDEYYKLFQSSTIQEKLSFSINLITQYTQMLEYISDCTAYDSIQKISIEDFGDAIYSQSGDCEDLALAIYLLFKVFVGSTFTCKNSKIIFIFDKSKQLLLGYVPMIAIEGVSANNVQNAVKGNKHKKQQQTETSSPAPELSGAHAAGKFIPLHLFYQFLCTWSEQHALTLHVKKEMDEYFRNNKDLNKDDLIILIGEGTGILEGGIIEDQLKKERDYVYKCSVMNKAKKIIIPPTRTISPFYQALLFGFTDKYLESHGIGTFYFGTLEPSKHFTVSSKFSIKDKAKVVFQKSSNRLSYYGRILDSKNNNKEIGKGCTFADFINGMKHVMIIPCGAMNNVDVDYKEFDSRILSMMKRISRTRPPMPILDGYPNQKNVIVNIETYSPCGVINQQNDQLNYDNSGLFVVDTDLWEIEQCIVGKTINEQEGVIEDDTTPLIYHTFSTHEHLLLLKLCTLFKNHNKTKARRDGKKPYGCISIHILEDYIDTTFVNEIASYFIENTEVLKVGNLVIYKENHTNNYYTYRLDFVFYK